MSASSPSPHPSPSESGSRGSVPAASSSPSESPSSSESGSGSVPASRLLAIGAAVAVGVWIEGVGAGVDLLAVLEPVIVGVAVLRIRPELRLLFIGRPVVVGVVWTRGDVRTAVIALDGVDAARDPVAVDALEVAAGGEREDEKEGLFHGCSSRPPFWRSLPRRSRADVCYVGSPPGDVPLKRKQFLVELPGLVHEIEQKPPRGGVARAPGRWRSKPMCRLQGERFGLGSPVAFAPRAVPRHRRSGRSASAGPRETASRRASRDRRSVAAGSAECAPIRVGALGRSAGRWGQSQS